MPRKNRLKIYATNSHYHVYNRGADGRVVFADDQDYRMFILILRRYLSFEIIKDSCGRPYDKLHAEVSLMAFCLMPTHFHLLIYQMSDDGMEKLLRRVITSYGMYFNHRHGRSGSLFQDIYRASRVGRDEYLETVIDYIHNNPSRPGSSPSSYKYSSASLYDQGNFPDWVVQNSTLQGRTLQAVPDI